MYIKVYKLLKLGDWGLGIGDCNPKSTIPNPQRAELIFLN